MRIPYRLAAIPVLLLALFPSPSGFGGAQSMVDEQPPVLVATLPDQPLGVTLNRLQPGVTNNDRGFLLGTLGSDMWRARTDPPNEFYMVGDRGPNGQIRVDGANRRTFPVPGWTPLIAHVRVEAESLTVLNLIPIAGASGAWVGGMPNIPGFDEVPYDYAASEVLEYNASGLDTEGLVRMRNGEFWLVDEYSPSLLHVDPAGRVIARYIPEGLRLEGADYPVIEAMPAIYGKRKVNRGFEALAMSADERTLYIGLQSPLLNPDAATGNPSRNTRILAWDIASAQVSAEYVYHLEDATEFMGVRTPPEEMKVSGLAWVNATTLLVLERTDWVAKIYSVDLRTATNIHGSPWSAVGTSPSLESLADPAAGGLTVLPKQLVIDLSTVAGMPDKIEGLAIVDATTLAVCNDNDSDIGDFDTQGNNMGTGARSHLLYVRLDQALPL